MALVDNKFDLAVIGAGPSGSVASAILAKKGYRVLVLEKSYFPRFSIGESLLPQCMVMLEEANMLDNVESANFQHKNGAIFAKGAMSATFDFSDKFTLGPATTFQVQRDRFDKILADTAAKKGVTICYGHTVLGIDNIDDGAVLLIKDDKEKTFSVKVNFILDASGFAKVLPRLLNLEIPTSFPPRTSLFTHIQDNITDESYDRNKILITVCKQRDLWFWLIPFSNGKASIGLVATQDFIEKQTEDNKTILQQLVVQERGLSHLLKNAEYNNIIGKMTGYSSNVSKLYGKNFALLGNAGEFIDPIFSSGLTIALKSATLASETLDRQLKGQNPDWEKEFVKPLQIGINTFKEFVTAWYDGRLQTIIFSDIRGEAISRMINSILAGYAWDTENPYVKKPYRISALAELCGSKQ